MAEAEPLLDPAVQANPFEYYEQLREHQPVLRMPGTGFYVLTRYEDLRAVLRDPETFSNTLDLEELSGEKARQLGALFQQRLTEKGWPHAPTLHQPDPPEHTRHRPRAACAAGTPRSGTPTSRPRPSTTWPTCSQNAAKSLPTT